MSADKKVVVGGVAYTIDETRMAAPEVAAAIEAAMRNGTVFSVPVVDDGRSKNLYLHGGRVDCVLVDPDLGPPRPGEISP